jgi:Uncharacterized protein conserved in bacteria (DUF2219)
MRPTAGLLLALATAGLSATGANAASPSAQAITPAQRALLNDIYTPKNVTAPRNVRQQKAPRRPSDLVAATLHVRTSPETQAATGGVFVMPAYTGGGLDQTRLLEPERLVSGEGLAVSRTDEVSYAHGAAVDTVRVTVAGVARGRGGVVAAGPDALLEPDAEAFDVTFTRGWPSAVKMSAGEYALDISPHAGLGVNNVGTTAEAGAMMRIGRDIVDRLGVKTVSSRDIVHQGHWFLFAAASGRAVGLNMMQTDQGVQRAGWSAEPSSALISDAQAGLGWRLGPMQASVGYVHRSVKSQTLATTPTGPANYHDSMVAFSLSLGGR